jgi:hypothetical protein
MGGRTFWDNWGLERPTPLAGRTVQVLDVEKLEEPSSESLPTNQPPASQPTNKQTNTNKTKGKKNTTLSAMHGVART